MRFVDIPKARLAFHRFFAYCYLSSECLIVVIFSKYIFFIYQY